MNDWQPELIKEVLGLLIPSRVSIAVVSRSFEEIANLEEPWYGTKYKLDLIEDAVIQVSLIPLVIFAIFAYPWDRFRHFR